MSRTKEQIEQLMVELHGHLLDRLIELVKNADPENKPSAVLEVARKFLRDNNIDALLENADPETREKILGLADEALPFSPRENAA